MRKFIIHSRKGLTTIMEVECEIVKALEDPSVMWLQPGEYRARILAPTTFHQKVEKVVDGKKETVLVPDVWCWHAFYDTLEQAQKRAAQDIVYDMQIFACKKNKTPASDEEVQQVISQIEVVML